MKSKKVICNRAKITIVLAGNYNQYREFVSKQDLLNTRFIYGCELKNLLGIAVDQIIICGTFWDLTKAGIIYDEAMNRLEVSRGK